MEKQVAAFIQDNANKSTAELALLLSKNTELPKDFIINQINGKKKAKTKFPFLLDIQGFEFPSPRAISQASSELAAIFKSNLFKGKRMADLSGGMGLDSYFFSKQFKQVSYVELNTELFNQVKTNFEVLKVQNISTHNQLAADFINESEEQFDLIYLDPDRRVSKSKAFKIDECEPNLTQLLPLIWERTNHCLVKLSPMLDISQALTELKHCKTVYVIALKNDCKELLFHLEKGFEGTTSIKTINITSKKNQKFDFTFEMENQSTANYSEPQHYLLDPNVAILKAGAFKSISKKFNLNKLGINTHLYTSDKKCVNFPGRHFKVLEEVKLKKGRFPLAQVICKNYPLKSEQLKAKFKIKEGGNYYLIALCDYKNKNRVFLCEKC